MKPVVIVDVVGLTPGLLGERTPHLNRLVERGACAPMTTVLPAVTCSAQATMLTGLSPQEHGAVGNGWMDPATMDIALWRQSNRLVSGEKVYEAMRRLDPDATCCKLFWWWNMGADVTWSITPRPYYPADGRKILAVYSSPTEFGRETEEALGKFPFFDFWGPKSGLASSRWIADAAIRALAEKRPTLTLVYLPHLDYDHQRYGPHDARSQEAVREIDAVFGDLAQAAERAGAELVVVSEYGIVPADLPVDVNLALRRQGLLAVRETPAGDVLDPFASRAFAVVDHQLAHVYTRDARAQAEACELLRSLPGVERVCAGSERGELGLDHPRAGDVVALADHNAWFTYYYWTSPEHEPDFARTVDIHRKPGYDPCELFVDPALKVPFARVARRLLQKKLGFRYLMDVIPTDPHLVQGSHGRLPAAPSDGPVFLCSRPFAECGGEPADGTVRMESVKDRVLTLLQR